MSGSQERDPRGDRCKLLVTGGDRLAAIGELVTDFRRERTAGGMLLWMGARDRELTHEIALQTLLRHPPSPLVAHDGLDEVTRSTAQRIVQHGAHRDLAYRSGQIMPLDRASALAARAVAAIPANTRWWTNGMFSADGAMNAWNPMTDWTFDTGVVGVSDAEILVVWFMAED